MAFDTLHNYYERLVISQLVQETKGRTLDLGTDELEDIACVALNKLPARYIRHDIDLAFYLTSEEREKLETSVIKAVNEAIDYVVSRRQVHTSAS